MHSAKPDKPLFAATDLLTELPEGVAFRQAEVWTGLESALQRRRRRTVLLRLSVAATFLLALALGWWLRPANTTGHELAIDTKTRETTTVSPIQTPTPGAVTATVAIIPKQKTGAGHTQSVHVSHTPVDAPVEIQSAQVAVVPTPDTARSTAQPALTAAAQPPAAPARRFRISHMNDNAPPQTLIAEAPVDERNGNFFHIPGTGSAGPSPEYTDPATERKPRTLMSLFKPHQ